MSIINLTVFTNVVLILSVLLLIAVTLYCIIVTKIDHKRYKVYLSLQKENVVHKNVSDMQPSGENQALLGQTTKLVSKYRALSPYQLFLIIFFLSSVLLVLPCCIYGVKQATGFAEWCKIFLNSIFVTMKVFVLGNSLPETLPSGLLLELPYKTMQAYSLCLHMLFVGGGLLVARAAFSLFKEFAAYLKYWVIHPCSDIYIMSKLNEKSVALAEDLFKTESPVKIFADAETLKTKPKLVRIGAYSKTLFTSIVCFLIIVVFFLAAIVGAVLMLIVWMVSCMVVGLFCLLTCGLLVKTRWLKDTIWKGGHKLMVVYAKAGCDFCVKRSAIFNRLFHKQRIYFCDVYPQNNDYQTELINRAKNIGAIVMKRDVTGLRMKWWCRSRTVYIIGEDDGENTKQAMSLYRSCTRSATQNEILNRPETQIYVFAADSESEYVLDWLNAELWDAYHTNTKYKLKVDKRWNRKEFESPFMKIRRINEYVNFAVSFFWKHWKRFFEAAKPLDDVEELNVAIVGCGKYGYEFLKVLSCVGQLPNYRLKVQVFDNDIERCKQRFSSEFLENITTESSPLSQEMKHRLPYYIITFEDDIDINDRIFFEKIKENTTHVFVMLGDDELNINTSLRIRTMFERRGQCETAIYAIVNDYQKAYNLKQAEKLCEFNIHPIGRTMTRYSEKAIKQQDIENWAVSVHKRFIFNKVLGEIYNTVEQQFNLALQEVSNLSKDLFEELYKNFKQTILIDAYQISLHQINKVWEEEVRHDLLATINRWDWTVKDLSFYERLLKKKLALMYDYETGQYTQEESEKVHAALLKFAEKQTNLIQEKIGEIEFELLKMHYDRCEYYRRTSKSRALFEFLLFKKGILISGKNSRVVIAKNVAKEYFDEEEWKRQGDYNLPHTEWGLKELKTKTEINKQGWENGQWYELNNIMQKRWMVFMWSEGYRYDDKESFEGVQRMNYVKKTHRYLVPYSDLFQHEQDRVSQTMEFINMEQVAQRRAEIE